MGKEICNLGCYVARKIKQRDSKATLGMLLSKHCGERGMLINCNRDYKTMGKKGNAS